MRATEGRILAEMDPNERITLQATRDNTSDRPIEGYEEKTEAYLMKRMDAMTAIGPARILSLVERVEISPRWMDVVWRIYR